MRRLPPIGRFASDLGNPAIDVPNQSFRGVLEYHVVAIMIEGFIWYDPPHK